MQNNTIMVVIGEHDWTLKAVHLASAVALSRGSQVLLLKMVPVRHPILLGTDLGYVDLTYQDQRKIVEYQCAAARYGVKVESCIFQYTGYISGLIDAADQFHADMVFAMPPKRLFALQRRIDVWWLTRALAQDHRTLYTLEQTGDQTEWTPQVTVVPEAPAALPATKPEERVIHQLEMPGLHLK